MKILNYRGPIARSRTSGQTAYTTNVKRMLVDSRNIDDGTIVSTEVCIIGAGPAGITIAIELMNKNLSVCLLESGDINENADASSLAEGEVTGDPFTPLRDMRHRQFGGQSNVWNISLDPGVGVRYVDLSAIDFEKRDWVPYSGWPITKDQLIPYYQRAHELCKLGDYNYETTPWESEITPSVKFRNDEVKSSMFKFGPSKIFNGEYQKQIKHSKSVAAYTNSTAVEIELDVAGKSVRQVHASSLTGKKLTVQAKYFILAAGGTENPRLLLMSNKVQKTGIGNQHDVVGRYFMDHPLVYAGILFPRDKRIISSLALYDKRRLNNDVVMGKFELSEDVLRREKMLHMSMMLFPREKQFKSESKTSARVLVNALKRRELPKRAAYHLRNVILHSHELITEWYRHHVAKEIVKPNLAFGNWSSEKNFEKKYTKFEAIAQTEQAPDPDNRVVLSNRRDRLGLPQVKLINYWRDIDKENVRKAESIFARAFTTAGLGDMNVEPLEQQRVLLSTHHNMGTTRMSEDPRRGVVDAQCKVHGISNLYVAGSSVFPTGGYANPTLTIIALAIRLADHINDNLNLRIISEPKI